MNAGMYSDTLFRHRIHLFLAPLVLGLGLGLSGCRSYRGADATTWFVPDQESKVLGSMVASFDEERWGDAGSAVRLNVSTVPHEGLDPRLQVPLTRLEVKDASAWTTDAAARVLWPVQWKEQEPVSLCVYARATNPTPEGAESRFEVVVRDAASRQRLGTASFAVDRHGGALLVPLQARAFAGAEGLEIAVYLGGAVQGLDIAVMQLVAEAAGTMPRVNNIYFPGRGQASAVESTKVQLTVLTSDGKPEAGWKVDVERLSQPAPVGARIDRHLWIDHPGKDAGRWYRDGVMHRFGTVMLTDWFSWRGWADARRATVRQELVAALNQAHEAGLSLVGGPLVVPGEPAMVPPEAADWSEEDFERHQRAYVDGVVKAAGAAVDHWVVVDEPWEDARHLKGLFDQVAAADPGAARYLGVGELLTVPEGVFADRLKHLGAWRAAGVQADALAVSLSEQVRVGWVLPGVEQVRARLDALEAAGWRVVVSRLAVASSGRALQVDWIGEQVAMMREHAAVDMILIDGFWSGVGPGAGWLGSDGTVLPGGASLDRLLRPSSDGKATATLDANGQTVLELDPGVYAVTVGDAEPRELVVPLRKKALIVRWGLK